MRGARGESRGEKDVLGLWTAENEGARFWTGVLAELKNRGAADILIACANGLSGFLEAARAVCPRTWAQLCIVRMARNSARFASHKDLKKARADLKAIHSAAAEEAGRAALAGFGEKRDSKCPVIFRRWECHWDDLREFFKRPPEIRRAIYATNAAESLNCHLRKAAKNRSAFRADDAMLKMLCLAIRNASRKWTMPIGEWGQALNQFAVEFGKERVPF